MFGCLMTLAARASWKQRARAPAASRASGGQTRESKRSGGALLERVGGAVAVPLRPRLRNPATLRRGMAFLLALQLETQLRGQARPFEEAVLGEVAVGAHV